MWSVFIFMILFCYVQPTFSLGPHVEVGLYVLVPVMLLLILAIGFRFWWECQQDRRQFEYDEDSHLVDDVRELDSPATEPPITRGTLVFRQTCETFPNPYAPDTLTQFDLSPSECITKQARLNSDSPSSVDDDFETQNSVRTPCSKHPSKRYVHSTEKKHETYRYGNEKQECFRDSAMFSAHLYNHESRVIDNTIWKKKQDHNHCYIMDKVNLFSPSDFSKDKKSRTWKLNRRSKSNVYIISGSKPCYVRNLFPRFESRRKHTFPTSQELEVVCENESYNTINALCASLQKAFIHYHNQMNATSLYSQAPLKSCLKQGSGQRKSSKHVTFKLKSSVFKAKKKKKSRKLKNRVISLSQTESYFHTCQSLKTSEQIIDRSIDQTHDVQITISSSGTRSAISPITYNVQKNNEKTGLSSDRFQKEISSKPLSLSAEYNQNCNVRTWPSEDPEVIEANYHYFGDYYSVNGDFYYSGHNFKEYINLCGFDTRQD